MKGRKGGEGGRRKGWKEKDGNERTERKGDGKEQKATIKANEKP